MKFKKNTWQNKRPAWKAANCFHQSVAAGEGLDVVGVAVITNWNKKSVFFLFFYEKLRQFFSKTKFCVRIVEKQFNEAFVKP